MYFLKMIAAGLLKKMVNNLINLLAQPLPRAVVGSVKPAVLFAQAEFDNLFAAPNICQGAK